MTSNPTKIKPKPHKIPPISLILSLFMNVIITPTKASAAIAIFKNFNDENATITPVIVVPMFAPMIIAVA